MNTMLQIGSMVVCNVSRHICCTAASQTTPEVCILAPGGNVGRGHESHLTRPFPFTVIPADLPVGAESCCQNINKRDYMKNDSPLSGFGV